MSLDDRFTITTSIVKDDFYTIIHTIYDEHNDTYFTVKCSATLEKDGTTGLYLLEYDSGESRFFHSLASVIRFLEHWRK